VVDDGARFEFEMWRYANELKRPSDAVDLPFTHRPNGRARIMGVEVVTNSRGLREDREIAVPKPAGTTRILMLGDSVTFGFGVAQNDTTARRVEGLLNEKGPGRFEVINAGVGNYNTAMQVAAYLQHQQSLSPDVVILNFFVNDAEPTPTAGGNLLTRYSMAAVYFTSRLDSVSRWANGAPGWQQYYAGLYDAGQPGWQLAKAAIDALQKACAANGVRLAIVNYPDLHQTTPYPLAVITARIKEVAAAHALPFLDLTPEVVGEDAPSLWVNAGDPHPNGHTTRKYAQRIATWLTSEMLTAP
jgi:lysophospholipase L1-like esterase